MSVPAAPVRVLMVMGRLTERAGGGERAVVGLALSLPRDRFDVTVCTTRPSRGAPLQTLRAAGVDVVDIDRQKRFDVAAVRRMVRLVRSRRFDVIHGHMFGNSLWAVAIGRLCSVPVIIAHEQTWEYEGQPVRRLLDAVIGRLADTFVAVSARDAERMANLERVPREKIAVIPNAWAARPDAAGGDLRAELGIPAGAPLIATVALLRRQKRLDVMLDAFVLLRERMPEAVLVIVGNGEEREALEAHAERVGAAGVHFAGLREDVESVWRAADVAAMSSDFEGTPLSALEAMSFGVPLVATDVGGLPDIAGDGDANGAVLVPRRDPRALADALASVLEDGPRRAQLGEAARQRAGEFTAERHAERCAELYERLLAGSRRGRARV